MSSFAALAPATVFLFGDFSDPWFEPINDIYQESTSNRWMRVFLHDVASVVRVEVGAFDGALRDSLGLGNFVSLRDVAELYRHESDQVGFVHAIMAYVVRAVALLRYAKQNPDALRSRTIESLGISGGLFSASVLAVARDFDSLYEACVVMAALVCRHCGFALRRSRAVEESSRAWGWAITGVSADELDRSLIEFQKTMRIPAHKTVRVGIRGHGWSTVVGPPSVMELCLKQCPGLSSLGRMELPIFTLQHNSSCRLSSADFDHILGTSGLLGAPLIPGFRLWGLEDAQHGDMSSSHETWGSLLRVVIDHAFSRPVDIVGDVTRLCSRLGACRQIEVGVMGSTCHLPYILGALKAKVAGAQVTLIQDKPGSCAGNSEAGLPPNRIAIVGMGGRGPNSNSSDGLTQFWDVLKNAEDTARKIPDGRFNAEELFSARGDGGQASPCKSSTEFGCFLKDPGHFDAPFFRLSPREATLLDPGSRLFQMAAYEAVEMAGFADGRSRKIDPARIAVIYGQSNEDGYTTAHREKGCDAYTLQTVQRAFAPGRVAFHFGWEGPTWSVDSACSTSSSILHLATQSLLAGEVDMVVAGASNVMSSPHGWCALSKSGVLSNSGNCKTFRSDADGYCRGEFVGAVVLKRLEDAVAHHDNVLGIIAGTAKSQSGNAPSITTPDSHAQQQLFRRVVRDAGLTSSDVSYVEMHGTATPIGDACEMNAVVQALGRGRPGGPLPVGAVKANIGHSEAASGIASLFKGIFMFQHQLMPPQVGIPHPLNPNFPALDKFNVSIPFTPGQFSSPPAKPNRILINNVDAAGGNACVLLEDPAGIAALLQDNKTRDQNPDPRPAHVVVTSARSHVSLHINQDRLLHWLHANPGARLQDIAYTTTARRIQHPLRFACTVSSTQELISSLESSLACNDADAGVPKPRTLTKALPQRPPIVFVFTGQGSEYAGMGGELYRTSPKIRETVDLCARLCVEYGFPPFTDIITAAPGVDLAHKSAAQTQLAILTLELALAAFWRDVGVEPSMVIGHSLGEYAAMHVAGVLSLADALYLVGHRALLMEQMCDAGAFEMLAVLGPKESTDALIRSHQTQKQAPCTVACLNSPRATVISGTTESVAKLQEALSGQGVRSRRLPVAYGFHSPHVEPVLSDFASLATGVAYSPPRLPMASTLLGKVIDVPDVLNHDYLVRQTRQAVDFVSAVEAARNALEDPIWLEIGPKPTCGSFVRAILASSPCKVLSTLDDKVTDWASASNCMAEMYRSGVDIDWLRLHAPHEKGLKLLALPSYGWEVKDYWIRWNETLPVTNNPPSAASEELLHYTCAQHLVTPRSSLAKPQVAFRSSLAEPELRALVNGHCLRGVALCPGSVYCDAALASAVYLLQDGGRQVNNECLVLRNIVLIRPLNDSLVGPDGVIHTEATLEAGDLISVSFKATPSSPGSRAAHDVATCEVTVHDTAFVQAAWDRTSYYIKSRMDLVIENAKDGRGHRLQHEIFYALFSHAFEYRADGYKSIREAYISPDFQDAAAEVILSEGPARARFIASPYWGEGLVHLAGFLVNCHPSRPTAGTKTFVMTSMGSIERTAVLEPGKRYLSYVRVCKRQGDTATCEVTVFDDTSRIVMQCLDLHFRELHNSLFMPAFNRRNDISNESSVLEKRLPPSTRSPCADEPAMRKNKDGTASRTGPVREKINKSDKEVEETGDGGALRIVLEIIAEATGSDVSALTGSDNLAELGVDSIMAIEIAAQLEATSGSSLPPAEVLQCPTIDHLHSMLNSKDAQPQCNNSLSRSDESFSIISSNSESSDSSHEMDVPLATPLDRSAPISSPTSPQPAQDIPTEGSGNPLLNGLGEPEPKTRITLLQKSPKTEKLRLYLVADGFGSVSCYIYLVIHRLPAEVYGIDSPYLRCPSRLTPEVGIVNIAKLMVEAVVQFQPEGPLLLGGFSGGGTLAYEMCRQLADAGREIRGLVIIDMRCPLPPPDPVVEVSSGRTLPAEVIYELTHHTFALRAQGWDPNSNTMRHLERILDAVSNYHPPPLRPELSFPTAVIWCKKGMLARLWRDEQLAKRIVDCELPLKAYPGFMEDPRLGHVLWSILDKTDEDVGPNGWERFVNAAGSKHGVLCQSLDADHMEIVQPGRARETVGALREALDFLRQDFQK